MPAQLSELRRKSAFLRGLAEIRLVTIADGPGAGGRLLQARTPAGMALDIALDRGADLLRLAWQGREIGWHSATDAPNPWPPNDAEHGFGFMRGFDGFLVTCGLDHIGKPKETPADDFNYPLRQTHVHPLHGRIMAAKANLIVSRIDWEGEEAIIVEAAARQASVFGEVLELERRYVIDLFRPRIRLFDRVTNRGYRPTPHAILYHLNVGYPLLDRAARLTGPEWALRDRLDDGSAVPGDDHVEIVDSGPSPKPTYANLSEIGIDNPAIGTGLVIRYDAAVLPATTLWRAFQSGVFGLGLEPHTDMAKPQSLQAQGSVSYALEFELHAV